MTWSYNYTPSYNELYHHGVKGMKWGVRHDKKNIYKQRKKEANRKYESDYNKHTKGLDNLIVDLDRGRISRYEFEKANSKASKSIINDDNIRRNEIAKAKRDYKISIGKNVDKENIKYNKRLTKNENVKKTQWDNYVESVARDYPSVAARLAESGHISYKDLGKANETIKRETEELISSLMDEYQH